jgi:hypothetical protein
LDFYLLFIFYKLGLGVRVIWILNFNWFFNFVPVGHNKSTKNAQDKETLDLALWHGFLDVALGHGPLDGPEKKLNETNEKFEVGVYIFFCYCYCKEIH